MDREKPRFEIGVVVGQYIAPHFCRKTKGAKTFHHLVSYHSSIEDPHVIRLELEVNARGIEERRTGHDFLYHVAHTIFGVLDKVAREIQVEILLLHQIN